VPITIQLGDIANRLRRAFDVRGRIPTALDETIVPVAIVRDAGQVPYALDPLSWATNMDVTGTASNLGTIAITNEGPAGSVAVVELLHLAAGTAGHRIEVSRSGVKQTAIAPGATKYAADTSTKCQGLLTSVDTPILLSSWDVDITTVGSICEIFRCLTTHQPYRVQVVLRRGETCYVKNLTDAGLCSMTARGRFYSTLGDT